MPPSFNRVGIAPRAESMQRDSARAARWARGQTSQCQPRAVNRCRDGPSVSRVRLKGQMRQAFSNIGPLIHWD